MIENQLQLMNNNIGKKFESPLPHRPKPVPVAGFAIYNKISAKSVPTVCNYRTPELKKLPKYWYVEYYYKIPAPIRYLYKHKKWYRFRVKSEINWRKGAQKQEYADWFVSELTASLKAGYNPFEKDMEFARNEAAGIIVPDEVSASQALLIFLNTWSQRGLDPKSYTRYEMYVNRLIGWLEKKGILHGNIQNITNDHIQIFLNDMKREHSYSNRQFNNNKDFISTAFIFLKKKKFIDNNPCDGIDKLKAKSSKHRFYDEANLKAITAALLATDPYTYLAFQTVYYLCVRSDKELMNLKVGNIQWHENKILTESDGSKGGAGRYIPMDENIKKLLIDNRVDIYPADHYIFGIKGHPSPKPFGTGFFSKRFKKIREAAGLPDWFSMYGAKHTRVIHLKSDGVSDANIMALTGHKDFTAYAKYLRDLGLTVNIKDLNEKSRKI